MAKDPGNSRRTARPLRSVNPFRVIKDSVGPGDRIDVYRLNVLNRSSLTLSLKGLKANANLALLNNLGRVLQQSRRLGRKNEIIRTIADPGVYYVQVRGQGRNETRYRLRVATSLIPVPVLPPIPGGNPPIGGVPSPIPTPNPNPPIPSPTPTPTPAPANSAPVLSINGGLTVNRDGRSAIAGNVLRTTDQEQSPSQLTYTLTQLPRWGSIQRNGVTLTLNDSFTQDDLDKNRITYQHQSIAPLSTGRTVSGSPKISGSNIVWAASDGQDAEIFFYNGTTHTTTPLTSNTVDDFNPQLSGNNVVWQRGTGNTAEILRYDIATGATQTLSSGGLFDDVNLNLDGSTIVWQRDFTDDSDIKYWTPNESFVQTIIGATDTKPLVSGSNIAFERRSLSNPNDDGIYVFNTETNERTPIVLSTQTTLGGISGSTVVWDRLFPSANERDVFYRRVGESAQAIAENSDLDDFAPIISGSYIAFTRNQLSGDANDGLYLFNIETGALKRLSNSAADRATSISGSNVVWERVNNNRSLLFFYDGAVDQVRPLTNDTLNHTKPTISGNNIVWQSSPGATSNQVLFYGGSITRDNVGFRVSDGASSEAGTLQITIQ